MIHIGMVDLADMDHWIELDTTTAWCWQQGAMLQWLPGSQSEIIWNDGHCSYSPDKRWILYDSYPDGKMNQHIYLYDTVQQQRVELGVFHMPKQYWDCPPQYEWRCDLHPRFSRDGRTVVFDSPCSGQGRQLHLIDVSSVVS